MTEIDERLTRERRDELLEANNRLLERARRAEAEVARLREAMRGATVIANHAAAIIKEREAEIERLRARVAP